MIMYGKRVFLKKTPYDEFELYRIDGNGIEQLIETFDESSVADLQAKELAKATAEQGPQ